MQNIISTYEKLKKFNWKRVENTLVFTVVIFFVLSVFNTYAVENIKLDGTAGFGEGQETSQILFKDGEPNKYTDVTGTIKSNYISIAVNLCGIDCFEIKDKAAYNELSPIQKHGLVGGVSNGIQALYAEQPTVDLVAHLGQEWVPGYDQTAYGIYAADNGYDSLVDAGITKLWNATRNLAYILFVVVLIVAGFMIMFRQKIGGQLAVSIFNVIPRVVINLVLVTFSFAIVGIVIDFGAMLVNIIGGVLTDGVDYDLISATGPFALFKVFASGQNQAQYWQNTGFSSGVAMFITSFLGLMLGAGVGVGVSGAALGAAAIVPAVVGASVMALLVVIIVSAIVGWASIRVYITLLKAYIALLIDTIMGPLYIVFSTIPGNNSSGEWFKRILKNTLTFPLVFLFINLGMYILASGIEIGFPRGLVSGDLSANPSGTTYVGLLMKASIVLVLFFMAAEAPKFLEDVFPATGGKGAAAAMEAAREGAKKIPLIGGMF